jgi:GAF domain-containing protein
VHAEASLGDLVTVVQELSLARSLDAVMQIVRQKARQLTGADGATFVLREGELCYYADEDAIAPLWKGRRFPLDICISGWVMLNRQPAVISDVYADPRIPADAYRPTFVQSLVMVPIRTIAPIGAIGNYWAEQRPPAPQEVKLLQALADSTAVALENVQVYQELEQRVRSRTAQLQQSVDQLRQALREIKTLRGLIPICAHCKSIRDDAGYWHRLERYLTLHTEAEFSHGICSDCLAQHYGDLGTGAPS